MLSFLPRYVLDEILDFIESVSVDMPTYPFETVGCDNFGEKMINFHFFPFNSLRDLFDLGVKKIKVNPELKFV